MWEITGAEFTNQGVHTADGISIRFPRVTRIRDDKDWQAATNLQELQVLFSRSSESADYSLLLDSVKSKRPHLDYNHDDNPLQLRSKRRKSRPADEEDHRSSNINDNKQSDEDRKRTPDERDKMSANKPFGNFSTPLLDASRKVDGDEARRRDFYCFIGTDVRISSQRNFNHMPCVVVEVRALK